MAPIQSLIVEGAFNIEIWNRYLITKRFYLTIFLPTKLFNFTDQYCIQFIYLIKFV